MSVNEQNLTGRKYRVWDAANNIWKRLSFWTKASDVELNDGTTVETTMGLVKGKSYVTIEQAMADLANIPVGSMVYTNDGDNYNVNASNVIYDDGTQQGSNLQTQVEALNSNLTNKTNKYAGTSGGATYVTVDSIGYDSTNKKLGLKVNGADTVIPFSSEPTWGTAITGAKSVTLNSSKTYVVAVGTYGASVSHNGTQLLKYQGSSVYGNTLGTFLLIKNATSVSCSGTDGSIVAVPID